MSVGTGDDFDSGDDLFDHVTEEDLLLIQGAKRDRSRDDNGSRASLVKRARHEPENGASEVESEDSRFRLAQSILMDKFGYPSFRHEQKAAINRILNNKNSLVIFPTGAGKSLCYQIPAIAFEEIDRQENLREPGHSGITIVVSPLIALMKDQVDTLKRKGIAAELLASSNDWQEVQHINESIRQGKVRLLYCAPERLNNEGFIENMKRVNGGVRLVGVDEAHCISEWGHSFRPDYLKVARFVEEIKAERVICLTATATPVVADDVCAAFNISKDGVFRTSPYRPNLRLEATATKSNAEKFSLLFGFLKKHQGSTLIYVTQQKEAENLAKDVQKGGFPAKYFHAGMKPDEKKAVQDDFMASRVRIVVATIAFGMGIDKADLRNVVHWDLPSTIEEYCQQVGRAGRDGKESYCMLYLCPEDYYVKESFARGDLPSRQSIQDLLEDIFITQGAGLSPGDTLRASHYAQSSAFDIRQTTLSIIYAALELRFNLVRAVTPEYSSYKFEAGPAYYPRLKNDKSREAKAILDSAKKATKLHSVDPSTAAKLWGVRRNDLVHLLNELNNSGIVKLTVSGVEHKYRILRELPQKGEIGELSDKLFVDLKKRETQALDRMKQVVSFITGTKCYASFIADHFGMDLPDDKSRCGHCTVCMDGKSVQLPPAKRKIPDQAKIQKILDLTDVRDDPRFLARLAFGINSPRAQKLKLNKSPEFGLMADDDFEMTLKEFEKACN